MLLVLTAGVLHVRAQDRAYDHALQFELPQIEMKWSFPLKEKGIGILPYGMNYYFQSPQASFSPIVTNFTFRVFSLFYKDRIGAAFYLNGFGANLDVSNFNRYLLKQYGSEYTDLPTYNSYSSLNFYGPAIGIAYRWHYKSFIIEPNFLFGFEHLDEGLAETEFVLKQDGSNQFLDYKLTVVDGTPRQHSYRPRLLVGRRFSFKKFSTVFEGGLVIDYIYSPYAYNLTISQTSYGYPPTIEQINVRTVYRQYNCGIYLKANLHRPLR